MSRYRGDEQSGGDAARFMGYEEGEEQDWAGYPGYEGQYQNPNYSQEEKRMGDPRRQYGEEADSRALGRGVISAISNVSAMSEDGYKARYLKALRELNNVLEANNKIKAENQEVKRQLVEINKLRDDPKNSQIEGELDELRTINQELEYKITEILEIKEQYEEEINRERENTFRETEKSKQLAWKVGEQEQEIRSLKDGHTREIENLNDTINRLENANTAFKNQEFNLKQMYGGKEEANFKKINYLETQLTESKVQLTRERQKINNEIQGMSIRIRKETQTQLTAYKLQMTKLKDTNIQYQREIERLNKQLRDATERRAEKKNSEQRHINELQENVQNCKKEIRRLKQTLTNTHSIEIQKESLQKEVKILQSNLQGLTEECAQSKARVSLLQSSNQDLEGKNVRLETEVKKLKSEVERVEAEVKRKQTIINRQKGESDTLKNKVVKLQLEHDKHQGTGTRDNLNDLQDRIRQLKKKINFHGDKEPIEGERIEAINSMTSALEEKMDAIASENVQLTKRLQHYKEKCVVLQKKVDTSSQEVRVLSTKVQKYENFVPKLQSELQKAIKQSQYAQPSNTASQYLNPSENLLKEKLKEMNDRLILQSKYAKQELQTKCLEYDSKLVSAKLQISKLKQALKGESFFHNRITQLSQKLADTENKKLQLMVKLGDLERYKILAERLPNNSHNKDHSAKANAHHKELEDLKEAILEKDREILRLRGGHSAYGGYYNNQQRKENSSEFEIQELHERISHLASENNILIRSKEQLQAKNMELEHLVHSLRQHSHSLQNGTIQLSRVNEEAKKSYQDGVVQISKLRTQNEQFKKREIQHETQIDSIQQMFNVIHRRLEESLYKNTELIAQNNALKGITLVTSEQAPNFGIPGTYGKMMSQEQERNIQVEQQHHYDSSPQIAVVPKEQKRGYKKQSQNAFFGSKKDSDASYEYQTDFKGDGGFGEYY